MPRSAGVVRISFIILVLVVAICAPTVVLGYQAEVHGREAVQEKDFLTAARDYETAIRLLPWRADLKEKAALAYASRRSWDLALPLLEAARHQGGLSASGWDALGSAYWIASQDQEAQSAWSEGLGRYPHELIFYSRLALVYRELHNFPAERQALEVWLGTGQGSAQEHYEMGQLLLSSEPGRARDQLARAAEMDAEFAPAVRTLQATVDLAARETAAAQRPVIVGRGLALVNSWWLARNSFEEAARVDPGNSEAWAWLGEARQQTGADGKPQLDTALSLDPNSALVHALRGLYWKRQEKYTAELAEYMRAAQLEPGNPEWQVALGEAHSLNGDLPSALAAYQKATSLAPANPTYWRLLALFSAENGVQVTDVGLPAAKKAVALASDDAQAQDALGWAFAQAGLLYSAEQTLKKAASLAPTWALPHLHLAETYLRKGDQASAHHELEVAQQLDPGGATGAMAMQLMNQYFP